MYDFVLNKMFSCGNNDLVWWDGGELLWVIVWKYNQMSVIFYWFGSEVKICGY